ncbi:MAG: glycine zipper 2TM domain-containing protein [Herminiimonas sp.]|nr:glycine zipper 2TM domain-containing protein [Herminiimonas sp.]
MQTQTVSAPTRVHPLVAAAAVSVIVVSLLGVAAITGVIPSSHGSVAPSANGYAANAPLPLSSPDLQPAGTASTARYVTQDGQVLEVVPGTQRLTPVAQARYVGTERIVEPAPVVRRRRPVQHVAQTDYSRPAPVYQQQTYAPQPHPAQNYVADMHPVGTGIGAVAGGLLGNQIGGGNGKKLATVAGVLLGGYAGNEVAHNRNPLPW